MQLGQLVEFHFVVEIVLCCTLVNKRKKDRLFVFFVNCENHLETEYLTASIWYIPLVLPGKGYEFWSCRNSFVSFTVLLASQ